MNETKKQYPEQMTPARPTYLAQIRHITIEGWLTYGAPDGLIIKVVVKDGKGLPKEYEHQVSPFEEKPRDKARWFWKLACMKVIGKI